MKRLVSTIGLPKEEWLKYRKYVEVMQEQSPE